MLAVLPFLPAACSGSARVDPPAPPPVLQARCALPVVLPNRDATQAEVETWWGRDRTALRTCAARHDALATSSEERAE